MKAINFISSILFVGQVCAFAPKKSFFTRKKANSILTSSSTDSDTDLFTVNVALTREANKNNKIKNSIINHPTTKLLESTLALNVVELPCIEHGVGPDLSTFQELVQNNNKSDDDDDDDDNKIPMSKYDYVVITSPESAKVFSEHVQNENMNGLKLAAVGKATEKTLTDLGFHVDFVPSKANGKSLGNELPPVDKVKLNRVLYPASAKADDTIKETLESRKDASFTVTRFNTYDTVPVELSNDEMETVMDDIQIACFGSPSSVNAFLDNVDRILGIEDLDDDGKRATPGCNGNVIAVCIGSTTARRCLESGRWQAMDIYYPKKDPGIEGWADCCLQAAGDVMENSFWS